MGKPNRLHGHGFQPGSTLVAKFRLGKLAGGTEPSTLSMVELDSTTIKADGTFSLDFTVPQAPLADWYEVTFENGERKGTLNGGLRPDCE